ncbi:MAG: glycosyltransferase [Pseudomonadota bacterium]
MRIVHVVNRLDPEQGGPPRSALGLCQALARRGHEVTILTRYLAGFDESDTAMSGASGGTLRTVVAPSLRALASEVDSSADLVQFHSVWQPLTAWVSARCIREGVPYVIAPRGELDVWSMHQKSLKKFVYLGLLGRRIIARAGALHLLNEPERQGLSKLRLTGNYFLCPNGADPYEWQGVESLRGVFRKWLGMEEDAIMLFFFSRLHHKKGVHLLASAFERAAQRDPRLHLVLAGPDYGEEAALRNKLGMLTARGRVHFVGMLDGARRLEAMADADIFVLPSYQEGHPRSVIEAALAGKALMLSPYCNCPEFEQDDAAEIVPLDEVQWAESILTLASSETTRQQLSRKAQRIAAESLTWDAIGRRMERHYDAVRHSSSDLATLQ